MRLLGRRIVSGMPWPHRQPPKAQPAQQLAHGAHIGPHAEPLLDHYGQIGP
jgi:hypothetical protein